MSIIAHIVTYDSSGRTEQSGVTEWMGEKTRAKLTLLPFDPGIPGVPLCPRGPWDVERDGRGRQGESGQTERERERDRARETDGDSWRERDCYGMSSREFMTVQFSCTVTGETLSNQLHRNSDCFCLKWSRRSSTRCVI